MSKSREDVIKVKEILAQDTLLVAQDALNELSGQIGDCSTRDLISIFTAAMKAHREIVSDIVALTQQDSKAEQELAKEYDSKVDQLLQKFTS
jgi:hypothetical protein